MVRILVTEHVGAVAGVRQDVFRLGCSAPVDRAREVAVGAVATDFFMIRIEGDAYGATYTTTCRPGGYLRVSLARHKCKVKKHQGPYR